MTTMIAEPGLTLVDRAIHLIEALEAHGHYVRELVQGGNPLQLYGECTLCGIEFTVRYPYAPWDWSLPPIRPCPLVRS